MGAYMVTFVTSHVSALLGAAQTFLAFAGLGLFYDISVTG